MRTFIAIELSLEVQNLIASLQQQLQANVNSVKWITPRNIHLTLKFLGNTDITNKIQDKLNQITKNYPVMELETDGLGVFPSLKYPQILWLGLKENQQLIQLAGAIEKSLMDLGFPTENKTFKAHVTLGRFKSRPDLLPLTKIRPKALTQTVHDITLFQSTLTSNGPIYQILSRHTLAK